MHLERSDLVRVCPMSDTDARWDLAKWWLAPAEQLLPFRIWLLDRQRLPFPHPLPVVGWAL